MKSSFTFDGEVLRVTLTIEDEEERAIARLMEKYSIASVGVGRDSYSGYSRDVDNINEVSITLRKPEDA